MIRMIPIQFQDIVAVGIEVSLPKTTLITISTAKGYIMCGALDIQLLNDKLSERQIIAARAVGVRSIEQLLEAPLESVTYEAEALGIVPGMKGKEAIMRMM
ncbi:MAG: hypothetical protein JWM44_4005 [Bacilli bacterium]|nr:hypothetical protein [Bacilli bacterium]